MNLTTARDVSELATDVIELLGLRLAASVCSNGERSTLIEWAAGSALPDDDQIERLQLCKELLCQTAMFFGIKDARRWFTGATCPSVMSPADDVRAGNFDDARSSAERATDPERMIW